VFGERGLGQIRLSPFAARGRFPVNQMVGCRRQSTTISMPRISIASLKRTLRSAIIVASLPLGVEYAAPNATPPPVPPSARAFIDRNCAVCHRPSNPPAGIDLTALAFDLDDVDTFGRWVRVHDAVRDGKMPLGAKNLSAADREAFLAAIAEPMMAHEQMRVATRGRAVLRRLNRYEYENSIRDLLFAPWLQLRNALPEDGLVRRLNKSGQALDISHVQMARYIEAAEQAISLVISAARQPETQERFYAREQKRFIGRMRYGPFNHHPERAMIPVLGFDAQPDVLAETVPISVGASDPVKRELEAFATPAGTFNGNDYSFDQFNSPAGGRYHLKVSAYSIWIHTIWGTAGVPDRKPWWHPDRENTSRGRTTEPVTLYALRKGGEKRLLGSFDVGPDPAIHEMDVSLLPGEQILPDAARLFRSRPTFTGSPDATAEGMPGVAYRWLEVAGPLKSPGSVDGLRRLFGDLPVEWNDKGGITVTPRSAADADRLLRQFMAAAYRRPVGDGEVQRYLNIVQNQLAPGDGAHSHFADAMIAGYVAVLCSPGFLYLEEQPGRLDSYALASRLSYFLWNAPPDGELLRLAANGTLVRPEVLRAQTDRMLDEARSQDFINAFLDYWLDLRKIGDTTPDQTLYPDYYLDDLLTESALQETQLFFGCLLKTNLPARNVVQSDFTFLNSHLARHYGLPPVEGVAMREVKLPANSVRGGLLTQASVLRVTANGTTSSPVLRGASIMERILGAPTPPPPPGVPAIDPDTRGAVTIRQQLDKHRSITSCAACHSKIDPPGFALESFDVAGGWRDRYRSTDDGEPVNGLGKNGFEFSFKLSQPVDASGRLAGGESFRDVVEFKRLLLRDERQLAKNMAEQFIAYATGAPVEFGDRPEVERILDVARTDNYGMRTILHEIIQGDLFTHK
jgi:mono/diheme cytochrome c family protein